MDVVMDLYDYTTTIIANENIFNRRESEGNEEKEHHNETQS